LTSKLQFSATTCCQLC